MMTLWPTVKPCAAVVVIVTVVPDLVAPVGLAAMALVSPAELIVPLLVQDPSRLTVPPAAWTRPLLALIQLVPLMVTRPPAPSARIVPWFVKVTLVEPPQLGW